MSTTSSTPDTQPSSPLMDLRQRSNGELPQPTAITVPTLAESAPWLADARTRWLPLIAKAAAVASIAGMCLLAALAMMAVIGAAVLVICVVVALFLGVGLLAIAVKMWAYEAADAGPDTAGRDSANL